MMCLSMVVGFVSDFYHRPRSRNLYPFLFKCFDAIRALSFDGSRSVSRTVSIPGTVTVPGSVLRVIQVARIRTTMHDMEIMDHHL